MNQLSQHLLMHGGRNYRNEGLCVERRAEQNTCFVAGTLVHTQEGLRPIEQIKAGDYVLSKREDGSGEPEYKRVTKTYEFDNQETWFVAWVDKSLSQAFVDGSLTKADYLAAHGLGFVVTTLNHPFWVVRSDAMLLGKREGAPCFEEPYPCQQWLPADHLVEGMYLQLPDGREVEVIKSRRVYKMEKEMWGWVQRANDGRGFAINFSRRRIWVARTYLEILALPVPDWGWVVNPDYTYMKDLEAVKEGRSVPEARYCDKVYNLEVEDFHTYFVDTMGIWVHNCNVKTVTLYPVTAAHARIGQWQGEEI